METVKGSGPRFPAAAEHEVKMSFFMAWKDPIVIGSSMYGRDWSKPMDNEIMSTPSAIASSNAARRSAVEHPNDQQTLYIAILALGTPPLAVPSASPK